MGWEGRRLSAKHRAKIGAAVSAQNRRRFADPATCVSPAHQRSVVRRELRRPRGPLDLVVEALLAAAGEAYEREWPVPGTGYVADFYVERLGTVFECDGWAHSRHERRARDMIRDDFLRELGYEVVRLTRPVV